MTIWISEPGTGPIGFVQNSDLFRGIYVSGTPIWTRIGQQSILGHPFEKRLTSTLEFSWVVNGVSLQWGLNPFRVNPKPGFPAPGLQTIFPAPENKLNASGVFLHRLCI